MLLPLLIAIPMAESVLASTLAHLGQSTEMVMGVQLGGSLRRWSSLGASGRSRRDGRVCLRGYARVGKRNRPKSSDSDAGAGQEGMKGSWFAKLGMKSEGKNARVETETETDDEA